MKRLQDEGHEVSLFIKEKEYSSVYDGVLPKKKVPGEDDIIIFDSSGMGKIADLYRKNGYKVFGASGFHDELENSRGFGLEFMENHGISIPETEIFVDFAKGYEFIEKNKDDWYVFKPSGKNVAASWTYCGCDAEDLTLFMQYIEKNFANDIDDFVLQKFVEGKLISSEYWVGKNGFINPMNHTVEVKKLMNDDIGPSTGCQGNLVWIGEENSEIAELLQGCEEDLVKAGYIGPIDLNAIVNKDGIFGLEWTPRFGLDAMPTLLAMLDMDVGELISDLVEGTDTEMSFKSDFSGGVRITIPPYPIEPKSMKELQKISPNEGIPIRGLDEGYCDVYFYEVKVEGDLIIHSSGTGVIACVSSPGADPEDCFIDPMQLLDECKVPEKQYRTDLNKVLPEMYEEAMEVLNGNSRRKHNVHSSGRS